MRCKILALGAVFAGLAAPVLADEPLVLTYETFEAAVSHADIAACPPDIASEDRFCRVTLNMETVTVWAFSHEGDQPLVAMLPMDVNDLAIGQ